jgi:DNA-binding MarR family transcriptional regulator
LLQSHGVKNRGDERSLEKRDFEGLSEFRYQLRKFERFSEDASRANGITPLQYLLLLHLKGFPGREFANVGELAERLQAKAHGVAALISRCELRGLVRRRPSATDGREVHVHLLRKGAGLLTKLAALHRAELRSIRGKFPARVLGAHR